MMNRNKEAKTLDEFLEEGWEYQSGFAKECHILGKEDKRILVEPYLGDDPTGETYSVFFKYDARR